MHSKADCLIQRLAWIKLGEIAEQNRACGNRAIGNRANSGPPVSD